MHRDVPAYLAAEDLVDINVNMGSFALPPSFPVLRLRLVWSVEVAWTPQQSTRLAMLPNGKVVVALPHKHTVLLYNKEGKAKGGRLGFGEGDAGWQNVTHCTWRFCLHWMLPDVQIKRDELTTSSS